jgi:hypothetical protein
MRKTLPLLVLSLVLLGFSAPPASAATAPQLNTEASLIGLTFPSGDPCIVYDVRVDVLRFVSPADPTLFFYSVFVQDACTGQFLQGITGLVEPVAIGKSAFVVEPGYTGADLNVTVDGFDFLDQSNAPITFDLHWSKPPGSHLPDGLAAVTGTIARGELVINLDDSTTWNKWGSADFPWAGLWLCRFAAASQPHCLGQA